MPFRAEAVKLTCRSIYRVILAAQLNPATCSDKITLMEDQLALILGNLIDVAKFHCIRGSKLNIDSPPGKLLLSR